MPPPMNRPACARLEYTHTGCAGVRRAFVQHCCKKLGAHLHHKATDGQFPARVISASSSGKEARPNCLQPCTAKARPPISGGRAGLLRPHLIGKIHIDRTRSPDRKELQVVGKIDYVGKANSHGISPSCSAVGGRGAMPSAYSSTSFMRESCSALPNHSLNRTFCGSPGLGFISFSPKPGLPQNAG